MEFIACGFPGCGKKAHSRGLCVGHYRQQREGEQLRPLQRQFHGLTELQRFEMRVRKSDGCWTWTGGLTNGYGQFRDAALGKPVLAHRKAWALYCGSDPAGFGVLHKCDNPKCVRPDHLFLGDQADNIGDMHEKGRAKKRGMPGIEHHAAKLNDDLVRLMRASEESPFLLAKRLGLARRTIEDAKNRRTWKHVE